MAKDKDLELDVEEEGGKGSSKLFVIIGVLVLLLGGGAGAFFMMSGGEESEQETVDQADVQKPAIYVPLRPAFVVNFHENRQQYYLQINVSLMTRDEEVTEALTLHQPLIRSTLVSLFAAQELSELKSAEGKEALKGLAIEEINSVLSENAGLEGIEQVFFTSFVMQ